MIYIDIASKFSFHPRYRIFPGQAFSPSLACARFFIIPLRRLLSSSAAVTPVRDPLYQTKQSRTRSEDDGPYVRLLGDNLYTQSTYIITYSLDTSFSHARRRFSRHCTSLRLVTARESHCCMTFGNSTRVHSPIWH